MKKKRLLSFVIAFMLLCFVGTIANAVPVVTLNPLDSYITVSEPFEVEVLLNDDVFGQEVLGFGFNVSTSAYYTYDGFKYGDLFMLDSFTPGYTDVNAMAFGGVEGDDILLATLMFENLATNEVTETLSIEGMIGLFSGLFYYDYLYIPDLSDPDYDPDYLGANFNISASTPIQIHEAPIPEPSTFLLLGAGLLGLGGTLRKMK